MKKTATHVASLAFLTLFVTGMLHAQVGNAPSNIGATIPNPLKGSTDLVTVIKSIVDNVVLPIGGVIAVLAFIWVGFLFVTAQGNDTKLKAAKSAFLNASIGTAVLLGAWVITDLVANTIQQLRN